MPRVKRSLIRRTRIKRLRKQTKGFTGTRRTLLRTAMNAATKAGQYAYRDRRNRKRDFRALWVTRIGAAAKACDTSYSVMMGALHKADVALNRKILSEIAIDDFATFEQIAAFSKK